MSNKFSDVLNSRAATRTRAGVFLAGAARAIAIALCATHCSAFAASLSERPGVYLLRPPEHSQILLASAQAEWLDSDAGRTEGWRALPDARTAKRVANTGELVLIDWYARAGFEGHHGAWPDGVQYFAHATVTP